MVPLQAQVKNTLIDTNGPQLNVFVGFFSYCSVKPALRATSQQWPLFFHPGGQSIHCETLISVQCLGRAKSVALEYITIIP